MSLVSFKPDSTTEIVGGWDSHDQEYVLYVFDLRANAVYSMLWSNLCDYNEIDKVSTARLRDRLAKYLGFKVPDGFWERVERKEPERIRYELVGGVWYRGLYRDHTFQIPMFGEPYEEEATSLGDSDIEVVNVDDDDSEVTTIRPRHVRLVG